jgi:hypothetical protein
MMGRLIPRAGVRAGNDLGELPYLADVQRMANEAMTAAVVQLRMSGHSWQEIGTALGRDRRLVHREFHAAADAAMAADTAARAALAGAA